MDLEYYKPIYKTAEARVLYLTAVKGYGSITALAKDLGVKKQWISYVFKHGLALKYAGYLGRKFKFSPELLAYDTYVYLHGGYPACELYSKFVEVTDFFNDEDKKYILKGTYVKDPHKHVRV